MPRLRTCAALQGPSSVSMCTTNRFPCSAFVPTARGGIFISLGSAKLPDQIKVDEMIILMSMLFCNCE